MDGCDRDIAFAAPPLPTCAPYGVNDLLAGRAEAERVGWQARTYDRLSFAKLIKDETPCFEAGSFLLADDIIFKSYFIRRFYPQII